MNRQTDGNGLAVVVLAAGQGTRFRSSTAKVLHRAAGRSLLRHVLEAVRPLAAEQVVVVAGHQAEAVAAEAHTVAIRALDLVHQDQQLGTGHAVQQALAALAPSIDRVMVVPGDTPLLTAIALAELDAALGDGMAASMLTATFDNPDGYGRVVRDHDDTVVKIVEHVDASPDELNIAEGNAGMYVFRRDALTACLQRLEPNNAQGELYLTDVVPMLADYGAIAGVAVDEQIVAGVNDRRQLAAAATSLRQQHLDELMVVHGVGVIDPATTYVDVDVEIGPDTVIYPGTILERGTVIGQRSSIGPNSHLTACTVGDDVAVHSTRAVECVIGDRASVGPFTHLRAGTQLGSDTKAGSFVETKNSTVGHGSKIPHLSYVGDATVGEHVNIACGVITVNYDGRDKYRTVLEDGAFVGCDTMLIAPVTVGERGYTAAGSVITDDVPAGALAIARARQTNKPDWARSRE